MQPRGTTGGDGMGVTATITIEAEDREQLGEIFSAIGSVLSGLRSPSPSPSLAPSVAPDPTVEWYRVHGEEFLGRLTVNAHSALQLIAMSNADGVPFSTVSDAIGKRGTALAGTLASIGVATKSMDAPEPPFERDVKRKIYRMSPALREVFAGLLSPPSPRGGRVAAPSPLTAETGW
jgi:hypothetical protein